MMLLPSLNVATEMLVVAKLVDTLQPWEALVVLALTTMQSY